MALELVCLGSSLASHCVAHSPSLSPPPTPALNRYLSRPGGDATLRNRLVLHVPLLLLPIVFAEAVGLQLAAALCVVACVLASWHCGHLLHRSLKAL